MISKQKRNLINELAFLIIKEIDHMNDNNFVSPLYKKTNIRTLVHIVNSCKHYTNKQIKILINDIKTKSIINETETSHFSFDEEGNNIII
tara:strand:+ start:251 stop:520 length:270 start_codon:yes stop_codon:yes gene_type:complete